MLKNNFMPRGIYKHKIRHGMLGTKVYNSWISMKQRCSDKNHKSYKDYGGRGITICKNWIEFENFYKDMGDRPKGKTLDRKDNNKGYSRENCRWATWIEQASNRRNSLLITYKNKTQTVSQWSRDLGISFYKLAYGNKVKLPENLIICRLRFIIAVSKSL